MNFERRNVSFHNRIKVNSVRLRMNKPEHSWDRRSRQFYFVNKKKIKSVCVSQIRLISDCNCNTFVAFWRNKGITEQCSLFYEIKFSGSVVKKHKINFLAHLNVFVVICKWQIYSTGPYSVNNFSLSPYKLWVPKVYLQNHDPFKIAS